MLRIHWMEFKTELLKMMRLPMYAIPTIAFPIIFYLLFGVGLSRKTPPGAMSVSAYLLATYGAFGVIGASLFGFGVGIAVERGQGWLQVKRATPMPLSAWFTAKLGMAVVFSAVIVLGLFLAGATMGNVRFPAEVWLSMFLVLIAGALPFCAFGLAIGYFAGPNSAPAIVNLIYLPIAFASGLWVPIHMLPKAIQKIAPALPPYHFGQLALLQIGAGEGSIGGHVLALALFTLLFLALATIGYRRDEGKMYG
jgi:ABC-2 type transport system permease protein